MSQEKMLSFTEGGVQEAVVEKATDPVVSNVATPGDFAAQYPIPLDPNEIIAMCDEVSMVQNIPEQIQGLKAVMWRELNELAFTSGSAYVSFADGECPEEYSHDGDNFTLTLKNIGAKKSLTVSDILDSRTKAMGYGDAINQLTRPGASTEGMPGGPSFAAVDGRVLVRDLKEKEAMLASILVMNGWDNLLVNGDKSGSSLQFDGFANWEANNGVTFHSNANVSTSGSYYEVSGTFTSMDFDRFLGEGCVKPTHIFGHSRGIQELMMSYFQHGYQGSQIVNFQDGNRIVPGFNFASFVNTATGRVQVIADDNFALTETFDMTGTYPAAQYVTDLFAMRMMHQGVPLVQRVTQIPLSYRDLLPGCTAVSFQLWAKTALQIKHACAHGKYRMYAPGRTVGISTCTNIL